MIKISEIYGLIEPTVNGLLPLEFYNKIQAVSTCYNNWYRCHDLTVGLRATEKVEENHGFNENLIKTSAHNKLTA